MERKNSNIRLEINNLIDDAINNAVARRNSIENSEAALLSLSDEETTKIAGGLTNIAVTNYVKVPIICGGFQIPILEEF